MKVRRKFSILSVILAGALAFAQSSMSNESVIKMVKAGLGDDLIVSTIKAQPAHYSTGPDDLIALKTAGVSDKIISAMVERMSSVGAAPAPAGAVPAPAGAVSPPPPAAPPVNQAVAHADAATLRSVKKIFIEKMPNDLDQYLRAEVAKQFKGRVVVVLNKNDADGIMTGIDEEKTGTGAQITGRYLGLHDNATGTISLLDKTESTILWSDEAGDRSLIFGVMKRGGQRKVADRLISKLKKAMGL
jgi:hypothetical protein